MSCYHAIAAWQTQTGNIAIGKEQPDSHPLSLPCGNCLGCRMARAREWQLRCQLELQQHRSAVFTTLTYNDEHLPPTLDRRHLQLWLKRFRKALGNTRRIRFFASGEYGEINQRPHYHAILFGGSTLDQNTIEDTWGQGYVHTGDVTPASIAYVAGYNSKKIGYKKHVLEERVDPETGEVYTWQPPFVEMSRQPGLAGHTRQHRNSWRLFAVQNGCITPVPRYLHNAWKDTATKEEIEKLEDEKEKIQLAKGGTTKQQIISAEQIAEAKQKLQALKRKL